MYNYITCYADKDEDNGQLDDPGIVLDHSPPNNIHYISWTSGIIITLFLTSLFFLIPQHNPLLEPFYWFEFPICIATGWMLIFTIAIMFECAYFANITYAKNLKSFCILYAQAAGFYTVLTSIYYLVYTFGLDLYGPLPFAMYIGGSITFCLLHILHWLRYHLSFNLFSNSNINFFKSNLELIKDFSRE